MRKLLGATLLVATLLVGLLLPLVSAGPVEFGHTWGTSDFERADAVLVDSNGNVFLSGSSYNRFTGNQTVFVLKFDSVGNFLWNRAINLRVNGTGGLALAPGGDVYFLGQVYGDNGSASVLVARISSAGGLVWAESMPEIFYPGQIVADPSTGGFYVTSFGSSLGGMAVSAFNADGSFRWARFSTVTLYPNPAGLSVDTSNGPVFTYPRGNGSMGIAAFDAQGVLLAQRFLDASPSSIYYQDVVASAAGDVFALGSSSDASLYLTRFDSSLNPSWTIQARGIGFYDYPNRLVLMPDGSVNTLGSSFTESNFTQSTNLYHFGAAGTVLGGAAYVNSVLTNGQNTGLQVADGASLANGAVVMAGTTFGIPPMSSQPVSLSLSLVNQTWSVDRITWDVGTLSPTSVSLTLADPTVPVDDFSLSAGYQAWYGVVNAPASKLTVSIKTTQSSPTSPTVSFSTTVNGGRKPYTYSWSFGDGAFATGATPSHTYAGTGRYLVQVVVRDSAGLLGYGNAIVSIQGPPTILDIFMYPSPGYAGNWVSFYTDAIDADGGAIVQYQWSYGDGFVDYTSYSSTSHIYSSPGNYTLTLTVTDGDQGLSTSASLPVPILLRPDQPPVAGFYWSPFFPTVNRTVDFWGYYSYDPDGYITNYFWNFGDGSTFNSTYYYASHGFASSGNYTVTLTVTDNDGLTGSTGMALTVLPNQPPVASFGYSPYVPIVNQTVFFYGGFSYDPDGYIVAWNWSFGDGTNSGNQSGNFSHGGPYAYHVYAHYGSYVVTLTVTDNGGLSASINQSIYVDAPPVAVITPARAIGKVGTLLSFSANASFDPDGSIASYNWSFGDGSYARGPWVTHVYAVPGQYMVTLFLLDEYGAMSVATFSYPVTIPRSPVAIIAWSPSRPIAGQTTVAFDGSNSLDPDGAITTYIWEFGDGTVARGKSASHSYANAGTYTVELVVLDEDGLSNRDVQTLTVVAQSKGTVTASSVSMPLAGARVTLSQGGSVVLDLMSSADGSFSLGDLAPGTYAIAIAKAGYRTYTGTLVWDGLNGDLGTFRLEPLNVEPVGFAPAQIGMVGILAVAAVAGGVVAYRVRRKRRRPASPEDRR